VSETNNLERAFGDVLRMQTKARSYLHTDPEVTLMFARKATEAVLKAIFVARVSENVGDLMLNDLIDKLKRGKHLPKSIETHCRTIQFHGNFGAHDQEEENQAITTGFAQPCIHSLDYVCEWFRKTYGPSAPTSMHQANSTPIDSNFTEEVSRPQSQQTSNTQTMPASDKVVSNAPINSGAVLMPELALSDEKVELKPSEIKPKTTPKLELILVSDCDEKRETTLTAPFIVKRVAEALEIKVFKLIGELIELKVFATPDKAVEYDVVTSIAKKHGYSVKPSHSQ
jgi:hypothetical protein